MSEESISDESPNDSAVSPDGDYSLTTVPGLGQRRIEATERPSMSEWRGISSPSPETVPPVLEYISCCYQHTPQGYVVQVFLSRLEVEQCADQRERRRLVSAKLQALGDALLAAMERATGEGGE